MELFDLTGKKAVVTGAARTTGLCYAIARALNEAGAQIVILDIDKERMEQTVREAGGSDAGFFAVQCNLCDQESLEKGFQKALEILDGRLDILVNGAGTQYREDCEDFPIEKWNQVIAINLTSVFLLSQLAGRQMLSQGSGKIINIASMNSFFGGNRVPAYSASKGGIAQLTKALSNAWMGKGIQVNAIAPGYMNTELSRDLIQSELGKELCRNRIPAHRFGEPSDLAGAAIFLASAASDYVSGVILPVDGGCLGC